MSFESSRPEMTLLRVVESRLDAVSCFPERSVASFAKYLSTKIGVQTGYTSDKQTGNIGDMLRLLSEGRGMPRFGIRRRQNKWKEPRGRRFSRQHAALAQ